MKKIKLISSAKLTALSMGLLLAIFCVLGMSFTPYEEGEAGASGPRKSHWSTTSGSGCSSTTTHHNTTDWGKAVAHVAEGNGTVTVSYELVASGNYKATIDADYTALGPSASEAYVTWNSSTTGSGTTEFTAAQLNASHTLKVTFVAEPASGWALAGWSTSGSANDGAKGDNLSFTETLVIANGGAAFGSYSGSSETPTYNSYEKADKTEYYAYFVELEPVEVTMAAAVGGSYSYSCTDGSGTISSEEGSVVTMSAITLTAGTPESGYKFWGWYTLNGADEVYFSYDDTTTKTFAQATTVYAKFIHTDAALFQIKGGDGTTYYDLTAAAKAAQSSSSKVVVPTANGTLYEGTYTIPSGVTLLIPFDAGYTVYTTQPSDIQNKAEGQVTTAYRKLTMKSGAKIIVANGGAISLGAKMCAASGGAAGSGSVNGQYGCIDMLGTSQIEIQNGGNLYVWGYIYSSDCVETIDGVKQLNYQSSIVAHNGATVYEAFQMGDNHGGTCLSNTYSKVFVTNQYFIQNIEVPLTLESGATEKVFGSMYIRGNQNTSATFIGSGGLFSMNSGAYVRKYFDPIKDRQVYDLYGTATMSSITVKASVGSISSSSYVLPLTNNMTVNILSGSTATISYSASMLPGVEINIEKDAICNVSGSLFAYDADEWCKSGVKYGMLGWTKPLQFTAYNGNNNNTIRNTYMATTKLPDAKLMVNGTLNVNGYLITTSSGADICSEGNGQIYLKNGGSKGSTTLYQVDGTSSSVTTISSTTPAQLKHADGKYLETSGAAANTTITYANGHWGWIGTWEDKDGNVISNYTVSKLTEAALKAVNPAGLSQYDADGYLHTFDKWVVDEDKSVSANQELVFVPTFSHTPYITWITKNANGQVVNSRIPSAGKPVDPASYMEVLQIDEQTSKTYKHDFIGWAASEEGELLSDQSEVILVNVSGPTTYYAKYSAVRIINVEETEESSLDTESNTKTVKNEDVDEHVSVDETHVGAGGTLTVSTKEGAEENTIYESPETSITDGVVDVKDNATLQSTNTTIEGGEVTVSNGAAIVSETMAITGGTVTVDENATIQSKTTTITGGSVEVAGTLESTETTIGTDNVTISGTMNSTTTTIEEGANVSVAGTMNSANTSVADGASVTVDDGGTLEITEEFVLSASQGTVEVTDELTNETTTTQTASSGQVAGSGTVNVSNNANVSFLLTRNGGFKSYNWYAVATPWVISVPISAEGGIAVKQQDGSYKALKLGVDYDLLQYNSQRRAQSGQASGNWDYVEDLYENNTTAAVMKPGVFYMIAFTKPTDVIRFTKASGADFHYADNTELYYNGENGAVPAENGWNGVANPTTYNADMSGSAFAGQMYNPDNNTYSDDVEMSSVPVGVPVFIQVGSEGTLAATGETSSIAAAPKRAKNNVFKEIEVRFAAQESSYSDRILIQTENGKEDEYVIGVDLAKAGISSKAAQMWVNRYDAKLCRNTVNPVNNSAIYPLGLYAPQAGEYVIRVPKDQETDDMLYLTYDGRIIWNLSCEPYSLSLEKGNNMHYGLRLVRSNAPAVTTDMEQSATTGNQSQILKVLIDGQVYILRGGEMYTLTGQKAQ